MKIRPRKFQTGGNFNLDDWINGNQDYYNWYKTIYPNAQILAGNPLKQRNDNWNKTQLSSSHYTTDDLRRSAYNNYLYTNDYDARQEDLTHWGEQQSDFSTISDQDFVNRYNKQAQTIRDAREAPQTYNRTGYTGTNRTFRNMFWNRSRQGTNTPLYTIGYQDNIEDIEGTSTWQRRMDRYQKPFSEDTPEGQKNRTFYITRPDGTKIKVYKKQNGDIGLFNDPNDPESPKEDPNNPIEPNPNNPNPENPNNPLDKITGQHTENYGLNLKNLNLNKYIPGILGIGRLAGTLAANKSIYNETLKGIKPYLMQTYLTHRQVVGDEATKQGYYRRAAQGQTKAAQPFTADADRQMAYQMEAKRIGDEMRAQGDLADNAEIRRTSDESNQHQWSNTERRTQVANANLAELIKTNKLRHDLIAGWKAANWTSIDNALKKYEYEAEARNKEARALNDQIFALDSQYKLANDTTYQDKYDKLQEIYNKLEKDGKSISEIRNNEEFKKAKQDLENWQYQLRKRQLQELANYRNGYYLAKDGLKFTFKRKDDLLYKVSRDAVDHYRKMVKLTNDATVRTLPKPTKLVSHPKKMQSGGVAPFVVYTPISVGGEQSTQSTTDISSLLGAGNSSSSGKKSGKETTTLDVIKDLFKNVEGLPSDVNGVYKAMSDFLAKQSLFGGQLSTDDMSAMYLQQLQQLNNIKFSKAAYDDAKKLVESNKGLNEFAVTGSGHLVVQNMDSGELTYLRPEELKEKISNGENLNPLRNTDLLNLRAYSKSFDNGLLDVVSNGVGIEKIGEFIKAQLPKIESNESSIEGYTKHETNQIKKGLELLAEAPTGDYKYTIKDKTNREQAEQALKYLRNILPTNMKTILETHAQLQGTSLNQMLATLVSSNISTSHDISFDAVTGKAAKDADGKSKSNGENDMIPALAFFNGLGEKETFVIQDKTSDGLKRNTISAPITSGGANTGNITFDKLQSSDFGGQLNMNQATMGDALISPTGRQNIIIDGRIYQTELPIDQSAKNNEGIIKPDLRFLKNIEAADQELRSMGISKSDTKNVQKINEIYKKHNLPVLYTISDNKLTITSNYARFAIVNGVGTEDAFGENPEFNDAIQEVSGNKEREQFEQLMQQKSNNSKYKLDNGYGLFGMNWGETKLYKGTIYIPMVNSNISALGGTGYKAKGEEYNQIEAKQQAADAAREMGFNPAGDASNL